MHFLGIGFQGIIALCMIIHIIKTGQDRMWIFLVWIPLLGPLTYFLMIILPGLLGTKHGHKLVRGVHKTLNPDRELKEAQDNFEHIATVDNRIRLADALFDKGQFSEAMNHYRTAKTGVFENDANIMLKLAHAQLESGEAQACYDTLADFRVHHPTINSPEGHLLYARCCVALSERAKATEEYEALIGYFSGFEAKVRYIEALILWEDYAKANVQLEALNKDIARAPRHARELNKQWITQAKRMAATLK